ncbi:Probable GTP-binding protein EngB [Chromobacterium violaceum]|uniref:Probable GTP-binding protein EngB n=1 Tax=Chromobacterium violaceum TaxID=536 RepID=A0A447TLV8_CHRVL|nr:Probable GTP-binding protein EngB [Chromobacterium violaceum]
MRAHWVELLGRYLQTRQSLIGLLLIMDARHPLKELDRRMLEFFRVAGRPVHILLSKADKLSRQEQNKVLAEVKRELADYPSVSVQMFSSLKKTGVDVVEQVVKGWFDALPPQDDGMAEL